MLLTISFPLAFYAYDVPIDLFTYFEGAASFLFWFSIAALVIVFPLKNVADLFVQYIRKPRGALLFVGYLSVHLFLYGLLLEGLVAYSFKEPSVVNQISVNLASIPLYPASLSSVLAGFGFNPSLESFLPPVFVLALSFYTITLSLFIAVLVLTNIMKVVEIGKVCSTALKSRTLVVLPASRRYRRRCLLSISSHTDLYCGPDSRHYN